MLNHAPHLVDCQRAASPPRSAQNDNLCALTVASFLGGWKDNIIARVCNALRALKEEKVKKALRSMIFWLNDTRKVICTDSDSKKPLTIARFSSRCFAAAAPLCPSKTQKRPYELSPLKELLELLRRSNLSLWDVSQ